MTPDSGSERRVNRSLREIVDELLEHARDVARRSRTMTPAERRYAQERLQWLADEVWRVASGEVAPPSPPR